MSKSSSDTVLYANTVVIDKTILQHRIQIVFFMSNRIGNKGYYNTSTNIDWFLVSRGVKDFFIWIFVRDTDQA